MTVKGVQDFFDSLSTKGGNIFVMLLIFFAFQPVMLGLLYLAVIHHYELGVIGTVLLTTFGNFSGALLVLLTGNSSKQQMTDRAQSIVIPPIVVPPTPAPTPQNNTI